jgi:hypothetical protein
MEKAQLGELVDMSNPRAILEEVKIIMTEINSAFNGALKFEIFLYFIPIRYPYSVCFYHNPEYLPHPRAKTISGQ